MSTAEQANEFLGGLASDVDDTMAIVAPAMTFALVFWVKGRPMDADAICIFGPPEYLHEQPAVFRASAEVIGAKLLEAETHGLDNQEQVLFYEQDFYVLSNFSAFNLRWRDFTFPTLEHAYHWEKFANVQTNAATNAAIAVSGAPSAHEAFRLAREFRGYRRPDWDEVKVGIMQEMLRAKAEQHEYVRRKLLATGHRTLIENSWRDDYWGWGPNRDGKNMLGKLWMGVRAELRGEPLTLEP